MKHFTLAVGCVLLSLCAATFAAPPRQEPQTRPGIATQPRVRVENRGLNEAVPVSIQEWAVGDRPITAQITGSPQVRARLVQQPWAYHTVTVPTGQDMASALMMAGMEGWEAAGVQVTNQSGTSVLLKRPL
jgi:hypothetical protein